LESCLQDSFWECFVATHPPLVVLATVAAAFAAAYVAAVVDTMDSRNIPDRHMRVVVAVVVALQHEKKKKIVSGPHIYFAVCLFRKKDPFVHSYKRRVTTYHFLVALLYKEPRQEDTHRDRAHIQDSQLRQAIALATRRLRETSWG
jgi:hypothetical protein